MQSCRLSTSGKNTLHFFHKLRHSRTHTFKTHFSLSILMAIFPGEPGLAGFIEAKDDGSGVDSWSYKKNVQSSSQIITTNKSTANFLQLGCPSCRPSNSVKASKGKMTLKGKISHFTDLLTPVHLGSSSFDSDH